MPPRALRGAGVLAAHLRRHAYVALDGDGLGAQLHGQRTLAGAARQARAVTPAGPGEQVPRPEIIELRLACGERNELEARVARVHEAHRQFALVDHDVLELRRAHRLRRHDEDGQTEVDDHRDLRALLFRGIDRRRRLADEEAVGLLDLGERLFGADADQLLAGLREIDGFREEDEIFAVLITGLALRALRPGLRGQHEDLYPAALSRDREPL